MGLIKPKSINLLPIRASVTDLLGAPPGTAVELVDHKDRSKTALIILNCPKCGRSISIGDQYANYNFPFKMFTVPRRVTIKDKIDHVCGASFSISENVILWYNSVDK